VIQVSAPLAMEISSNNSSSLPVAKMLISTNNNKYPLDFADLVPEASMALESPRTRTTSHGCVSNDCEDPSS
jgi:hypothetical protein